jgi:uncharacterized protein YciI
MGICIIFLETNNYPNNNNTGRCFPKALFLCLSNSCMSVVPTVTNNKYYYYCLYFIHTSVSHIQQHNKHNTISLHQQQQRTAMAENSTYLQAVPALPPLASGIVAFPAATVNAGDALNENHLEAAEVEYATRKVLLKSGRATPHEVRDAKRRKQNLEAAHNFAAVAPAWANAITQQMTGLENRLTEQMTANTQQMTGLENRLTEQMTANTQQMTEQMTAITQQMTSLFAYHDARSYNRTYVGSPVNPIEVVPHMTTRELPTAAGVWFPATPGALDTCTSANVDPLLEFYDLPTDGRLAAKKALIKRYLGLGGAVLAL